MNHMLFFNMMEQHHTFTILNRPGQWIIWREGSTSWSLLSPDLTCLYFFLCGLLKDEVYIPPMPITLNNSKNKI
jgi:hypothetical protein